MSKRRHQQETQLARRIGQAAYEAREQRGLSPHEVANVLGISVWYYRQLECGRSCPDLPLLRALAAALDLRLDSLFRDIPCPPPEPLSRERWALLQRLRNAHPRTRQLISRVLHEVNHATKSSR